MDQRGVGPAPAAVERQLDARDLPAPAGVGVPPEGHLGPAAQPQGDNRVVRGAGDGRVDVEVVDDVVRVPPEAPRLGVLGRAHVRRQHPVVVQVVPVVRLRVRDLDPLEPLDGAPPDEPGQDQPDREPVVRGQPAPVLLVGHQHVVGGVERVGERDARAVAPVPALGELPGGAAEAQVPRGVERVRLVEAREQQQVAEGHPGPHRGRHARGAPVEALRLPVHVLLLAAVARAGHGDGEGAGREGDDLVHGEDQGPPLGGGRRRRRRRRRSGRGRRRRRRGRRRRRRRSGRSSIGRSGRRGVVADVDRHRVRAPLPAGDSAVVPHKVQGGLGDEPRGHQVVEGGLAVEGVPARESEHPGVPRDPRVPGPRVCLQGLGRRGRDPRGGGLGGGSHRRGGEGRDRGPRSVRRGGVDRGDGDRCGAERGRRAEGGRDLFFFFFLKTREQSKGSRQEERAGERGE